jgi:hypothetical protein
MHPNDTGMRQALDELEAGETGDDEAGEMADSLEEGR